MKKRLQPNKKGRPMNSHRLEFSAWLAQSIRERPDIKNQKALAEQLNVYASTVHYWLKGATEPDEGNIARLAQIFGVEEVYILRLLGKAPATAFENVVLTNPEAEIVRDLIAMRTENGTYETTLRAVSAVLDIGKVRIDAPSEEGFE